jgi:hypothetical protein
MYMHEHIYMAVNMDMDKDMDTDMQDSHGNRHVHGHGQTCSNKWGFIIPVSFYKERCFVTNQQNLTKLNYTDKNHSREAGNRAKSAEFRRIT